MPTITATPLGFGGVDETHPTTVYGGSGHSVSVLVCGNSFSGEVCRTYLNYSMTGVPSNAFIVSATLNLYCHSSLNNQGYQLTTLLASRTDSFVMGSLNWNNQPSTVHGSSLDWAVQGWQTSYAPSSSALNNVDVTALVQAAVGDTSITFRLWSADEAQPQSAVIWWEGDGIYDPALSITYTASNNTNFMMVF